MVSGVVVVGFNGAPGARPTLIRRILVRNAKDLQEAIFRAVPVAIEILPIEHKGKRPRVLDWIQVDFDAIC